MDDPNRVRLRDAMLAYTVLALKELRSAGISLAPQGGGWGWRSRGEGQFAYASPASASDFTIHFELAKQHETEEYATCVDALRGHPVIKDRLNTLVGTTFSASRVDLESLPDQLVLGLLDQDADRLDESRFDAAFAELYTWLIRDHETFAVIAPLLGLNLEGAPLKLEPDIEIDRMSNDEAVAAITAGLIKGGGPPGFVALRETERAAIRIRTELPILVGDDEPGRATADAESLRRIWSDIVEAVIQALRLFKAGTVWVPGLVYSQRHQNGRGFHSLPSRNPNFGVLGTYDLPASEGSAFIELWQSLASPEVAKRKPLTTALRRLTFAGERSRPEDQIIDLMIAAEAVFLAGEMTESANKLAMRSAAFLRNDSRSVREVFRHMKRGYNARSRLAHGGGINELKFADGTPATLGEYVDCISDYMRDGLGRLVRSAANGESLPTSDWDTYVLDALSS
jgi:hypothetical protein